MDTSASDSNTTKSPISWPGSSSIKQNFSLPSSIIYYMAKNPCSSNVYVKTTHSCKYFFEKTPILVAAYITEKPTKYLICLNENCKFDKMYKLEECCKNFDICLASKINIWFTHGLYISFTNQLKFYSQVLPKLYRCDFFQLYLLDLTIHYEEYKTLVSAIKKIYLNEVIIRYKEDESIVPLENILEAIPNIEDFYYSFNYNTLLTVNNKTMKNIASLENLSNLKSFSLIDLPEGLNAIDLETFINSHKNVVFWLQFHQTLSKQYEQQLEKLVESVIETEFLNRHIVYAWMDYNLYQILEKRFVAEFSRFNIGYLRFGDCPPRNSRIFNISKGWKRFKKCLTNISLPKKWSSNKL